MPGWNISCRKRFSHYLSWMDLSDVTICRIKCRWQMGFVILSRTTLKTSIPIFIVGFELNWNLEFAWCDKRMILKRGWSIHFHVINNSSQFTNCNLLFSAFIPWGSSDPFLSLFGTFHTSSVVVFPIYTVRGFNLSIEGCFNGFNKFLADGDSDEEVHR